jgi:hypothetical protein
MPMSPHRLALAGILAALLAVFAVSGVSVSAKQQAAVYDPIASAALRDDGTYQGECWPWVRKVVFEATGREIGFDYRQGFFEAGAVEVSLANARSGDVIQLANDANTAPDASYPGLHTLIVLENLGGGLVNGIDSNAQWDGIVRQRTGYDPTASAARYAGITFHVYRITGSAKPSAGTPGANTTLGAGDRAVVKADGDGLNLRTGAGTDKAIITKLPDGTIVTVTSAAPVTASGRAWVQVTTPLGDGWVAAQYLEKLPPTAPASSANPPRPLLLYRTYMPLVTSGDQ